MVEITLKNGSKFQIESLYFKGKFIDSNGTYAGGNGVMPFTESEVSKLDSALQQFGLSLQIAYSAVFPTEQVEEESNQEQPVE
jgi:hypothetical protein